MVGDVVGAQVNLGELFNQFVEKIVLDKFGNGLVQLEIVDDFADILTETIDVIIEVYLEVAGILGESTQVVERTVIEIKLACCLLQDGGKLFFIQLGIVSRQVRNVLISAI